MSRHAFRMQIRPELLGDYVARHAEVWPDMLAALRAAGWSRYTLFHDGAGTVFGYLECEDFDRALSDVGATDVAQRWTADMQQYFVPGTSAGDDRLVEYFHLD